MLSKIEREPLEEEVDITKLLKELKIEKEDFEITRDEEDAIVVGGRIVDDVLAKYVIGMDDESLITFLHMMRIRNGGSSTRIWCTRWRYSKNSRCRV